MQLSRAEIQLFFPETEIEIVGFSQQFPVTACSSQVVSECFLSFPPGYGKMKRQ